MQIAKMFASLGFKVDTAGLVVFKKAIAQARHELTNLNQGAKKSTNQLRSLRREVDKLSGSMGKIKNAGGNRNVGGSYRNLAGDVHKVRNALDSIANNQPRTTRALGKINAAVIAGTPHWDAYRRSIVQTRQTLRNLNGDLNRLRANARIDVRIRNQGGGGHGGGSGGSGGGLGGAAAGLGVRGFLGNMIPTMALGGIGAGVGFAGTRAVEAARDQTRMESMILMTSKSGEEFARTLNYVKGEAARLGLSSTELGKSFAQVSMSAQKLDQGTKEKMFTGFSEFMMSMGTSQDDQKGIFRAFNQMFSNNRLLQEEINQLSDRGIPATLVYDAAMKAYDTQSMQKIKKLQEDGKLDPNRVLPIMAEMVQDLAHDSGAYAKMMESSIVKQGKFYEQMRQTSKEIMDSGVDVYLGKVFGQLTILVKEVGKAVLGFQYLLGVLRDTVKWFNELTGSNNLLTFAVGILLLRFTGLSKGIRSATLILGKNKGMGMALTALFRGAFGRALGSMLLRFTLWGTAIWGVTKLLSFLGKELQRDKIGGWTVFDDMAMAVDILNLKIELLMANIGLAAANLNNWLYSPVRYHTGDTVSGHLRSLVGLDPSKDINNNPIYMADPKARVPSPYRPPTNNGSASSILKNYSSDPNNTALQNIYQSSRVLNKPKDFGSILVNIRNPDGTITSQRANLQQ